MTSLVMTSSEARSSFKKLMDDVCSNHEHAVITRKDGEHVVMISLQDFTSMEETFYLLRSPNNAQRLADSIADINAGRVLIKTGLELKHDQ